MLKLIIILKLKALTTSAERDIAAKEDVETNYNSQVESTNDDCMDSVSGVETCDEVIANTDMTENNLDSEIFSVISVSLHKICW